MPPELDTFPSDGTAPATALPRRLRIEPCIKFVRVFFNGEAVAESRRTRLLLESGHVPVYYIPRRDVHTQFLERSQHRTHCPHKGDAAYWNVAVGGRKALDAAWEYPVPLPGAPDLRDLVAFYWNRMDAWFEEDEQVYVHARDPNVRIDVLRSSRHVEVYLNGRCIADSHRPCMLLETGLPARYYLPKADVKLAFLQASDTRTRCPYKGEARHFSAAVDGRQVDDIAWSYPYPLTECAKVEDLICFYPDKVDALVVDGETVRA